MEPGPPVTSRPGNTLAISTSSGSLPPASQGTPLSASSIGGEPQQPSISIQSAPLSIVSVHSDAAGSHLPSGQCAPSTAFPLLDHQSLLSDLPPPEGTLFQVVAQEGVVGSTEPAVSAIAGPLTKGDAIQAVFDQLTAKRPEDGSAGVSTLSAAPTTLAATGLTRGSLPRPSPFFRIPLDLSLAGVNPLSPLHRIRRCLLGV